MLYIQFVTGYFIFCYYTMFFILFIYFVDI